MKYPNGWFRNKSCRQCLTVFEPSGPSHFYCSPACAQSGKRDAYYKRVYGTTLAAYEELKESQDARCYLCGSEGFRMNENAFDLLVLDHDHETGRVRKLLCHNCNRGLGLFQDNPDVLRTAANYVEAYREGATTIPQGSTPQANGGGSARPLTGKAAGDDIVCSTRRRVAAKAGEGVATFVEQQDAWLYGAGSEKIGKIVGGSKARGRELTEQFLKSVPAVKTLKSKVSHNVSVASELRGLDGRRLPIRSEHSALNTLLQSAGAVLCKQWLVDSYDALVRKGFKPGWSGDFTFLGWIHDEVQIAVREGLEEEVGRIVTECAKGAGEPYNFRVRLDSEFKIGTNWSECH